MDEKTILLVPHEWEWMVLDLLGPEALHDCTSEGTEFIVPDSTIRNALETYFASEGYADLSPREFLVKTGVLAR
jgi:hypothetical protein